MYQGFYTAPPDYPAIRRAVYELKDQFGAYPMFHAFPIGKSVLGRGIFALSIGPAEGSTLFVGGVHGMEWLTTLLLFRFGEDLLHALCRGEPLGEIDVRRALENRSVVIIPCLNPDGVEISVHHGGELVTSCGEPLEMEEEQLSCWQANAHGVDLNHNFDAGWETLKQMELDAGITGPAATRYGGEAPHSEPETRALVELCEGCRFRQAYAFHSQGEEIYYRYGEHTPSHSQLTAQILASSCGYKVASPTGLASHGGFKDWFIQRFHRPGFTIEIGRGSNPLPVEELEPIYARLIEMLLLAILM